MKHPIRTLEAAEFPKGLLEIPQPPTSLTYRGTLPPPSLALLAVVGSRRCTAYGARVVSHLLRGLTGYPVGIVSGLALGIDALAHEAALAAHLYTIAVPGSGLNESVLYPASHRSLAERILTAGGALLSPFPPDFKATKWSFTARNRIMAGMTHATLLAEAAEKSGTLITARLASDYNRDVLVVPGDIFSPTSAGVHQFLKLGATPVTCAEDILAALQISELAPPTLTITLSPREAEIVGLLKTPTTYDSLVHTLSLSAAEANALLMDLELRGLITQDNGHYFAII